MKITADTNVLVRAAVCDDAAQAAAAAELMAQAQVVAVTLATLCEFVWVLLSVYDFGRADVARAVRALLETERVVTDRPAVEAGLTILQAGGDFADGVIAHTGRALGGAVFTSFDRQAVKLLKAAGLEARLI